MGRVLFDFVGWLLFFSWLILVGLELKDTLRDWRSNAAQRRGDAVIDLTAVPADAGVERSPGRPSQDDRSLTGTAG